MAQILDDPDGDHDWRITAELASPLIGTTLRTTATVSDGSSTIS